MNRRSNQKSPLVGAGEMGDLIRSYEWEKNLLGPIETWPTSLITTVNLMLSSRFPMFLFWGPQLISFYNDAFRPSLGKEGKHPHILGLPGRDAWSEIWTDIKPLLDTVLSGEGTIWMTDALIPIYRNNQMEDVYWTFSYSPAFDDGGKLSGIFVTCMETTAEVHSRAIIESQTVRLTEKEEKLRNITSASPATLWLTDSAGEMTYLNDTWLQWTGKSLENQLGKGWIQAIHPDDREAFARTFKEAFSNRKPFECDIRIIREDGSILWVLEEGHPIYSANGDFAGFAGSSVDISDRKENERLVEANLRLLEKMVLERTKKLKTREAQLSQAQQLAGMASWELRLHDNEVTWSPEMFRFWGYEPGEIEVDIDHVVKSTHEDDLPILYDAIEKVKKGEEVEFEYRRFNKNREIVHITTKVRIITNEQGEPVSAFGIDLDITHRKKNEEDLAALNRELNAVHALAKIGSWRANYREHTYHWSDDMYHLYGYVPGELEIDLDNLGNVHPEDLTRVKKAHQTMAAGHPTPPFEFRRINKKGEISHVISKGDVVRDEKGMVLGALGVNMDVTELVQSEKALRDSENLTRSLLDVFPNPIYTFDFAKSKYHFANRSISVILGYADTGSFDINTHDFQKLLHSDDRQLLADHFFALSSLEDDQVSEVEYRLQTHEGSYRYFLSRDVVYSRDPDGLVSQIIGVLIDVSEQKENQFQLENMNKLLLDQNRLLEQEVLKEFSESFASYKVGTDFFDGITSELARKSELDYILLGKFVRQGAQYSVESFSLQYRGSKAKGIKYPVPGGPCEQVLYSNQYTFNQECHQSFPQSKMIADLNIVGFIGYPIFDAEHHLIGLLTAMHGEEINNEPYVRSLFSVAAKRVEMELERLANEQELASKNLRLKQQNDDLVSFNRVASHDLKEPIRKIQMFISRFDQKDLRMISERSQGYLTKIREAAGRMQNLIEDLLTFSSITRTDSLYESVDLMVILGEVLDEHSEVIKEKNAVIDYGDLPMIWGISFQLRQLFSNLIGNSLKYSKDDVAPEIAITAHKMAGSKLFDENIALTAPVYWQIAITDNGIGFNNKYAEQIFMPFSRLHGKTDYPGSGIGLGICKKIVEYHHGTISAEGKEGIGAKIRITLPATAARDN